MLRTSFHWRCSVFLRFASPEMLPRVPLYQVVDVEFVPGTRLLLYVGLHTEAGTTTGSHPWSQGRLLVSILLTL
jgi:hypothetical protein